MAGLRGCASHGVIIHSRGWLPKVGLLQATNLYLAMQLIMLTFSLRNSNECLSETEVAELA